MRFFAAVLALLLGVSTLSTLSIPPSLATNGHGCAPPIPPAIPGSPLPAPQTPGIVLINEILTQPHSTWNCSETGTYMLTLDSWLELYNPTSQPFDLYAAHAVIDSGPGTNPYYLPFGAAIAPRSYLVLFPYVETLFEQTATSTFRLVIGTTTIDSVTIPTLSSDQSYARTSDGVSTWFISSAPTIDAMNIIPSLTPTPATTLPPSPSSPPSHSSHGGYTGQSSGSTSTTSNARHKGFSNGTQPNWQALQLPFSKNTGNPGTSDAMSSSSPVGAPTNATTNTLDTPRRIALTLIAIALALSLFWCWKLFMPQQTGIQQGKIEKEETTKT
ncbi:MAG: lamin tail domain-containing protein [Chloroflexota bacterium]|nr:lamin tail domain-containing protein [Chloroflexota bacterium]